ncbi:DODA-type extradiol aromatic ring-opening family dioxygenase [Rubrivivax rivuli]|uniref:Dioxygenase n=1 Tax=Rubrivivax rivuli TaxID=1862385 RepID=A0A437RHP8_9BURK|nr:class III extradiol ring-cleavage dioxygenase [Rubrivivax rivuli]RVU46296.1 dioxygenase [Rubrivivax rivuli]
MTEHPARLPTYFISHGGGPWPWMAEMAEPMATLAASLRRVSAEAAAGGMLPRAVLCISGHWEAPVFTAQAAARPGMVFDYHGFPEHTYRIRYPAPGAPALAQRVQDLLQGAGIAAAQDTGRGYDHGTFAPLAVMYPQAEVPVIQLSLKAGYDPAEHLAAGRALAPLRDEGVLIVGSGLSFHNLRLRGPGAQAPSAAFDAWLHETLESGTPAERSARLLQWSQAPAARIAHPQEDHLLPLMVALGSAEGEKATTVYHEVMAWTGWTVSSWRFGSPQAR